jgi:hypothetical protein
LNVYAHSVPGGDRQAAETLAAIIEAGRQRGRRRNLKAEPNNPSHRGVHGEDAVDR